MTQSQAMLCALAGFFLWVTVDAAVKLGSQAALSPFMIMAALGTVGAGCVFVSTLFKKNISALYPHSWREQALICLCYIGVNYANVIALKHLPLTVFFIVVFTTPLVIAALSSVMKHETLTRIKIVCLIAGFFGVVLAVGIGGGGGDGLGYVAAFVSVLCFAFYTVLMRKISKTDTVQSTQFINALSVGLVGICGVYLQSAAVPQGWALAMIVAAGSINILGSVLYNTAIQNTASTNVAQLHYTQIISGALLGYLIWHEVPTWNLVAGSIVIIVSGMIVAAQARKKGLPL
jgi:drug/metabolite transporter (DMT)-like permease